MRELRTEPLASLLAGFNPRESFFFAAGDRVLLTSGEVARVAQPLVDPPGESGAFRAALREAFRRGEAAGVRDPIVVGALPFDLGRPAALVVPERYRWARLSDLRPASQDEAPRGAAPRGAAEGEAFVAGVRAVLGLLADGPLEKVVLSRALDLATSGEIDVRGALERIVRGNPGAYCYAVPLADGATLLGASPELLLAKRGEALVTNPLAGSIPRARFPDEASAAEHFGASAKDLLEHRLVVEQVAAALARWCGALSVPAAPSVLRTSALWHLSSRIEGALLDRTTDALTLVEALHPTPAVCGHPRELARAAIDRVEGFDRGFFTGATGWMDARGDGEWAVTIRCAVLSGRQVRAYAGAGIVRGSTPEAEWAETAAKLTPMLRVFEAAGREDSL